VKEISALVLCLVCPDVIIIGLLLSSAALDMSVAACECVCVHVCAHVHVRVHVHVYLSRAFSLSFRFVLYCLPSAYVCVYVCVFGVMIRVVLMSVGLRLKCMFVLRLSLVVQNMMSLSPRSLHRLHCNTTATQLQHNATQYNTKQHSATQFSSFECVLCPS